MLTNQELVQEWLDTLATTHTAEQVAETQHVLDQFLFHLRKGFADLTEADLQAYVREVGGADPRELAGAVLQLQAVSLLFDFLRARKVIDVNHAKAFRRRWFAGLLVAMNDMEKGGTGGFRFATGRFADEDGRKVTWSFHGDPKGLANALR